MTPDLDTLLIARYAEIDDHVIFSGRRVPGQPKKLSDAEMVCLAVAQVLLGARSEHHWLRMCCARLGHLFPYLPGEYGYHKRVKAAAPLLAAAITPSTAASASWRGWSGRSAAGQRWSDSVRHLRCDSAAGPGSRLKATRGHCRDQDAVAQLEEAIGWARWRP